MDGLFVKIGFWQIYVVEPNVGEASHQFLVILDLWGISFHAAIVYGLGRYEHEAHKISAETILFWI